MALLRREIRTELVGGVGTDNPMGAAYATWYARWPEQRFNLIEFTADEQAVR